MRYQNIIEGTFLSRPNRFIAMVEIDGKVEICHVKNTGRCKELLVEGARVFLEQSDNPQRKTKFDVIAVIKQNKRINMDSQAPNQVFHEWVKQSGYFSKITWIKPEYKYKNSRFDFCIETEEKKHLVEIKGVTLEKDGVLQFPDAPTERGVKHIKELIEGVKEGYGGHIFFVAQMEECRYFIPNRTTHPAFADALCDAAKQGVKVRCVNCVVTHDALEIKDFVPVVLTKTEEEQ